MKISHQWLIISIVFVLFAISGCMSQKEIMVKKGYPLSYADGFDDGCHSGKKAGGDMFDQFKKDVMRFEKDYRYAQGCSMASDNVKQNKKQRQIRMGMEQQCLMEEMKHNKWEEQRHLVREVMKGIDTRGLDNLK